MQKTTCLIYNIIMIKSYAFLFNSTTIYRVPASVWTYTINSFVDPMFGTPLFSALVVIVRVVNH